VALPVRPLPLTIEIAPGGDPIDPNTWSWIDVTEFVRYEPGIAIDGGQRDEGDQVDTTNCQITVDNRDGRFSPRNPLGAYYPDLARNTPLRVRYTQDSDSFTTTAVGSWGTTDRGLTYSLTGVGGTVDAADFDVTGGEAVHHVEVANAFRISYIPAATSSLLDVELAITARLAITDVTGNSLAPGLMLRIQDTLNYYHVTLAITTAEAVFVVIQKIVAGVTTQLAAVNSGLTHAAAQSLRLRAQVVGQTIRGKAWAASGPEPAAWTAEAQDTAFEEAGGWGVLSFATSGNTNAPVDFFYDDLEVNVDRFVGFVAEWPSRWDYSTRDAFVPVVATGIIRRLQQGAQKIGSTLYRRITSFDPQAYWPLEDEVDTTLSGSPIAGVDPMRVRGFEFGADSDLPGSRPLPVIGAGDIYSGTVPRWSGATEWHVEFVYRIEMAGATQAMMSVITAGSISEWQITIQNSALTVNAFDNNGDVVFTQGITPTSFFGPWSRLALFAEQNGADIDWSIRWFPIGSDGFIFSDTAAGETLGAVRRVAAGPRGPAANDLGFGHVSVWREANVPYYLFADTGFNGERALTRIARICAEESVTFDALGDAIVSEEMGPQPDGSLLDIVYDCVQADGGILSELNGGLAYRPRANLYNQEVSLALDMDAFEVGAPFEPTDDDQQIVNDVTASRPSGSSARVVDTASVAREGLYEEEISVNVGFDELLPNIAAWYVHLGTVDQMRFPVVPLNFARAPQLIESWLAMRLGDRTTVEQTLPQLTAVPIDLLGLGWSEQISPFTWTAAINAVPASPYNVGVLDDDVSGRLDTDGSDLDVAINTVATSLVVNTTVAGAPLWTTDGAEFPFDIRIDSEEMTVTNITGASSPQTFTVTRGVNGLLAAHDAGALVSLAQPLILAR
jgi:hypothetical protein